MSPQQFNSIVNYHPPVLLVVDDITLPLIDGSYELRLKKGTRVQPVIGSGRVSPIVEDLDPTDQIKMKQMPFLFKLTISPEYLELAH